ncbi:alpha/beta hydrolase [Tepidicaulis sp. LMO-SS28]|uniref:alpha/beta hydrolase n=1 Tax=Tepidicaulis sp. LMO-SS28 TaxID=3447455 RepID=UPI003EDF157A
MRKLLYGLSGLIILGALAFAGVFLAYLPSQLGNAARSPITETPLAAGLAYEEVLVTPADKEIALRGWWIPAEEPKAGLLVVHGAGGNRQLRHSGGADFYRALHEAGFAILAIDLRNHGQSGGDGTGKLGLGLTEKEDARAALEELRARLPGKPLYALGISMGGATLIHAASDGLKLDGLVLLDPLLDHDSTALHGSHAVTGLPESLLAPSIWSAQTFFGLPENGARALEPAARLDLPILLIQDAADPITRAPFAEELARQGKRVKLWLAPAVAPDHPEMQSAGRWGAHGRAFIFHPGPVMDEIKGFTAATLPAPALAETGSPAEMETESGQALRQ